MNKEELLKVKKQIDEQVIDNKNISMLHIREDNETTRVHPDFKIIKKILDDINLTGYDTIDETIQALQDFKANVKHLAERHPNYTIEKLESVDSDYGEYGGFISTFGYAMYNCEITDEEVKRVQNKRFRDFLAEKLETSVSPSCELVELFMSDKIDWDTLKELTDKNCNL